MIQRTRIFKTKIVWSLMMLFLLESVVFPTTAFALTAGPSQPEFQSFTPVTTTNMVNTNTGDFKYNLPVLSIPGADGGGYALSLAYDADPSMEKEASWVGQNWTLSPGALNRLKKGIPDDYDGIVKQYNQSRPSWTFTRSTGPGIRSSFEGSVDSENGGSSINISYTQNNSFNNYTGYSRTHSIGASASFSVVQKNEGGGNAIASVGIGGNLSFTGRDISFDVNVSISPKLDGIISKAKGQTASNKLKGNFGYRALRSFSRSFRPNISLGGRHGIIGHIGASVASVVKPSRGLNLNFGGAGTAIAATQSVDYHNVENLRVEYPQPEIDYHAYGHMYNPNKNRHLYHLDRGEHVMSDYGIEKNSNYSRRDKITGVVHNNADYFNVVGEGISGTYSLHHNKVGHYHPDFYAESKVVNHKILNHLSGGLGVVGTGSNNGLAVQIATNIQLENKSETKSKRWLNFQESGDLETNADDYEFADQADYDNGSELPFFKAKNDLGGALVYSDLGDLNNFPDPKDLTAIVENYRGGFFGLIRTGILTSPFDGEDNANRPNISKYISQERYDGEDYYNGRASYMEYIRNSDLYNPSNNTYTLGNAFDKNEATTNYLKGRSTSPLGNGTLEDTDLRERIAQIRVWNPDGLKYTYGLPVYVKDEANLTYGVDPSNKRRYGNGNSTVYGDRYYPNADEGGLLVKLGQKLEEAYANTHLLTQITTTNYIDLEGDGCTDDDFGGFTCFDYKRWTRNDNSVSDPLNNWYRFRSPYTGLAHEPNELSKENDDMGHVSHGLREVYHLNAIETKSHVALFITNKTKAATDFLKWGITDAKYDGSGDNRRDGLGQIAETENVNGLPIAGAINDNRAKDVDQDLVKLERIVLFAKSELTNNSLNPKPLVSTHFDYDYTAWTNVHNNALATPFNPTPNSNATSLRGKLTLKKVWFEYEGVKNYKISPYEFGYTYKKANGISNGKANFSSNVKYWYPNLFDSNGNWKDIPNYSDAAQKPYYNPLAIDRWGNIEYNGEERNEKHQDWVYQGDYVDPNEFDPAAWLLKQIKLPSGGEILIQYEEKTYTKVQDKDAMAMVSLIGNDVSIDDNPDGTMNKFYLNLEDIGIKSTDTDYREKQEAIITLLNKNYMRGGKEIPDPAIPTAFFYKRQRESNSTVYEKLYFKMQYKLTQDAPSFDFVNGYADIRRIGIDANGVYVSLGNTSEAAVFQNRKGIPRSLCHDYLQYNNHDNYEFEYSSLNASEGAYSSFHASDYYGFKDFVDNGPYSSTNTLVDEAKQHFQRMKSDFEGKDYPTFVSGQTCAEINFEESYLRIPMVTPKRGGGVRVKRVLLYDDGMESGDEQMYGTEYDYVKEDGTCSGVATNEPNEGREENALIDYEKRDEQNPVERVFAGRDRKEGEVPYGEFILPVPNVNYSRVVTHSIYVKGKKQSTGFQVNEYFTTADYPTKMKYNDGRFTNSILKGKESVAFTKLTGKEPSKDDRRRNYKRWSFVPIPLGIFNYNLHYRWTAQGFMFIQTNMNGQMKSQSTYSGVYDSNYFSNTSYVTSGEILLTHKATYNYYEPGEKVKVIDYSPPTNPGNKGNYSVVERHLGLEDNVAMTTQSVYEESVNANLSVGLMLSWAGGFQASVDPLTFGFSLSEAGMSRHMTTRTLNFPAIVKSVTTRNYDSEKTVENLAFSSLTGQPIITKTIDGYDRAIVANTLVAGGHDGAMYNWNMPAAWFYREMGQKALDPNNTNRLQIMASRITSYGDEGNPIGSRTGGINDWVHDNNPKNILMASASTLKKDWFDNSSKSLSVVPEYLSSNSTLTTTVQHELNKTYRAYQTYTYNREEETTSANTEGGNSWGINNQKTYKSGLYNAFKMFDWEALGTNFNWKATNEVTTYSPNGYALEEINQVTFIPSAVKYGYNKFLATAIAQNAEYRTIGFESFEDELFVSNTNKINTAHAGAYGLIINNLAQTVIANCKATDRVKNEDFGNGFLVRLWAKNELQGDRSNVVNFGLGTGAIQVALKSPVNGGPIITSTSEKIVAQVGEWKLLEYYFTPLDLKPNGNAAIFQNFDLQLSTVQNVNQVIVDDVRIQPYQAELNTNVYDSKSFRLQASFGTEHFATFYQYNGEGQLVRKLIETERGLKVVQEGQTYTKRGNTRN